MKKTDAERLVFSTRGGTPISPNNVLRRSIFPACDALKLKTTRIWSKTRCSRLERSGCEAKLAGFREDAFGQSAITRPLANRIVHNRFWHENAWL